MNSITNPRSKAKQQQFIIHPHFSDVLFRLRRTTQKVKELVDDKKHLKDTIEFYNVLYPTDCEVETEAGLVKINVELLKRKLATCQVLVNIGAIDEVREVLSMIPSDWAPDYMKPYADTINFSTDDVRQSLLRRVRDQMAWIKRVQSGELVYNKKYRIV